MWFRAVQHWSPDFRARYEQAMHVHYLYEAREIKCILPDAVYPITHGSFLQDTRLVLSLIVTVEVDASHSTCDLGPENQSRDKFGLIGTPGGILLRLTCS